jgi:stage V sporulation protein B
MDHSKTIRDIIVVFIISVITAIFAYILRIYVARTYSVEDYGLLYAMLAFFSFILILVDVGLFQSMIKKIAEYRSKDDEQSVKDLLFTSFVIQSFFAGIISIVLLIFSNYINNNFFHNSNILFFYIFLFWILTYPLTYFVIAYLLGYEKTTWWALSELMKIVSILIVSVILYSFTQSIISVFIGYALMNLLLILMFFIVNINFFIPFNFHFRFRLVYPNLLTYGIYVVIAGTASIILIQTDTLMITYLLGLTSVGIYQAAVPLATILITIIAPITAVLLSRVSNLWAQKKKKEIESLLLLVQKYLLIIVMPITLTLALFANLVISILFTNQYSSATHPLIILSFAFMISAISSILIYTLIAIGNAKKVMYIVIFGAIINLFGNYFLINIYNITGAAISTLITSVIMFIMLRYALGKKLIINFKYDELSKTLFAVTLFILSIYLCRKIIVTNYLLEAMLCIFISGIIYLVTLFLTKAITSEDIKFIMALIKK